MTGPAQDALEALTADFPPWHFQWSVPSQGCRSRVWAARALPCHPHADADPVLSRQFTGSGETVDADTPAGMRKLLEERS
jgi:hypothetical protein